MSEIDNLKRELHILREQWLQTARMHLNLLEAEERRIKIALIFTSVAAMIFTIIACFVTP